MQTRESEIIEFKKSTAQLKEAFKTYSKWEEEITPYGIEHINEEQLIQYIRDSNETGRLNYIYRNPVEALGKLNLISEDGFLNNAGYYLFGNDGPVTLKEVIYPTDDRDNFTDLKQFRGNIFECINEGMRYIQNNIHYAAEIIGAKRVETPEVPVKAVREIIVNAFAHCKYQKGDYNEITITKSKIKIYNPGGILNDVNPIDFANGKIGSKIRNPLIATVLFKNGLIDAFGTGFDRTFKVCAENNVAYEYKNDEYGFTFVFIRNDKKLSDVNADDKKAANAKTDNNINDSIDNKIDNKINSKTKGKLKSLDSELIKILKENIYITIPEMAKKVQKSEATIHRHLNSLSKIGILSRIGSRKTGYWKLIDIYR